MKPPIRNVEKPDPAPWTTNQIRWSPNARSFPMTHTRKGNRWAGLAAFSLGLLFTILSVAGMVGGTWWRGHHWATTLMLIPFLATSLMILVYGASRFLSQRVVVIREEEVEVDEFEIFGRTHWQERLRRYGGVLKRARYLGDSGRRAGDTYYEILLSHRNPKRNVVLFRARSWRRVDTAWREFSKRFRIPALEETAQGINQVSHFGVDQFVKARSRNKDVAWWEPGPTDFSPRLQLHKEGTNFRLEHPLKWGVWREVQALITSGFLVAGGAFLLPPQYSGPVLTIGAGALLIFTGRLLWRRVAREELVLSYAGLEHSVSTPWGDKLIKQLPSELIQNILIESSGWPPQTAVCAHAGRDTLRFGTNLTQDDKEKLHDFIILVLSHGPAELRPSA